MAGHIICFVSFHFDLFRFVLFRFDFVSFSFRLVSFRFDLFSFVSFRSVSFLFRFALYRDPRLYIVIMSEVICSMPPMYKIISQNVCCRSLFSLCL